MHYLAVRKTGMTKRLNTTDHHRPNVSGPAPSRMQMLGRNWEVVVDQVPTAQNKKQKL